MELKEEKYLQKNVLEQTQVAPPIPQKRQAAKVEDIVSNCENIINLYFIRINDAIR